MAQRLGKLLPGGYYHIFNRGNNRENLFLEETNYEYFIQQYRKYLESTVQTFAYCLLKNHFHFLIRIASEETDPSRQFAHFFNSYAKSLNRRYGRTGSLFQERFRRKEVDGLESLRYVAHSWCKSSFVRSQMCSFAIRFNSIS